MMTVVLWATLDHLENATREQFASSERAVLDVMSGISHIALLTREYHEIQPYLENLLEDTRIEQVLLVDARGIIVAGTRPESIGRFPGAFSRSVTIDATTGAHRYWRTADVRKGEQWLGVLAIEFSDAALRKMRVEALNLGIGIAVTGMLLIAVVGLLVGFLLTRRLGRVTDAARRFARGDSWARAAVTGRDEIGDLGETFDRMADSLQARSAESRELIEQLSDKNAELERFAYTVSHDLKTPLVTIKGYLGMIERDLQDGRHDRIGKDFQFVTTAADTMAQLLEDLLQLSRVGRVVNEPEPVDLTELFAETVALLKVPIENRKAEVKVQQHMPKAFGDRRRLYEVAQNLLENALKFSRDVDTPEITVNAHEESDRIVCCIEDNGIGVEPEYQEQIFGLFNRLDHSYEGTGIGLALVKRIVELHGGDIWIESDGLGKGARFCFSLPGLPDSP